MAITYELQNTLTLTDLTGISLAGQLVYSLDKERFVVFQQYGFPNVQVRVDLFKCPDLSIDIEHLDTITFDATLGPTDEIVGYGQFYPLGDGRWIFGLGSEGLSASGFAFIILDFDDDTINVRTPFTIGSFTARTEGSQRNGQTEIIVIDSTTFVVGVIQGSSLTTNAVRNLYLQGKKVDVSTDTPSIGSEYKVQIGTHRTMRTAGWGAKFVDNNRVVLEGYFTDGASAILTVCKVIWNHSSNTVSYTTTTASGANTSLANSSNRHYQLSDSSAFVSTGFRPSGATSFNREWHSYSGTNTITRISTFNDVTYPYTGYNWIDPVIARWHGDTSLTFYLGLHDDTGAEFEQVSLSPSPNPLNWQDNGYVYLDSDRHVITNILSNTSYEVRLYTVDPPVPGVAFVKLFDGSKTEMFAGAKEQIIETVDGLALTEARFFDLKEIAYTWDGKDRGRVNYGNRLYVIDEGKFRLIHLDETFNYIRMPFNAFSTTDTTFPSVLIASMAINSAKTKVYTVKGDNGGSPGANGLQEWNITQDLVTTTDEFPGYIGPDLLQYNSNIVTSTDSYYQIQCVTMDGNDNLYYVELLSNNYTIKKRTPSGVTTTFFDFSGIISVYAPHAHQERQLGITWSPYDNKIYCAYTPELINADPLTLTLSMHFATINMSGTKEEIADPITYSGGVLCMPPIPSKYGLVWYRLDVAGNHQYDTVASYDINTQELTVYDMDEYSGAFVVPFKDYGTILGDGDAYIDSANQMWVVRPNGPRYTYSPLPDLYHYINAVGVSSDWNLVIAIRYNGYQYWYEPES